MNLTPAPVVQSPYQKTAFPAAVSSALTVGHASSAFASSDS
jgi:hypothetical protein